MAFLADSPVKTSQLGKKESTAAASKSHVTRSKRGAKGGEGDQLVSLPSEGSESDASESSGSGDDSD